MTMTTTAEKAPELPEVKSLPFLDVPATEARAKQMVAKFLAEAADDAPADRIRAIADTLDRLETRLAKVRIRRDAAAYTIEAYHPRPPGKVNMARAASLSQALGVGRTRWKAIKDRLSQDPPALVPNAPKVLPKLAEETVLLQVQVDLLHHERDRALYDLKQTTGITNAEASRLIGRDPARVSHLMKRVTTA